MFDRFARLPGAVMRGRGPERFLYRQGTRRDRVVLVAHADTYWADWTERYGQGGHGVVFDGRCMRSANPGCGLGADDRAGCAIVWLLRDTGHSILITDGEEIGCRGSTWLMLDPCNQNIARAINHGHQFVVEFDRRNASDFKCYDVGTEAFRHYIRQATGYAEPDTRSSTDIRHLCRHIAGVNLSIGYYNEHTGNEYLDVCSWQATLNLCRKWLARTDLPHFALAHACACSV